eukprot:XP_001700511.1 predicted protein [Chlamydomonas reinhardtii]
MASALLACIWMLTAVLAQPRVTTETDYVYITPKLDTEENPAWSEVISGSNIIGDGSDGGFNIRTGDFVEVVYAANTSRVTGRRMLLSDQPAVLDFQIIQPGSPKEVFTGDPIQVSSYIYVINTCGWPQSTTTDKLRQLYFTGSQNIQDYHSTCSYNKVFFPEANTRIFDNINVPCSGTVQSGVLKYNYDSSNSCGAAEQFAWRMAGEDLARSVKCGWAGLGSVGCSGRSCSVYIKGGYANSLLYGDKSDIMGTAGSSPGYLCMNAGNQLRVGWNAPLATLTPPLADFSIVGRLLDGTRTEPGRWELPAAAGTDTNHLLLDFNSRGGQAFPNAFLSFRARGSGFDSILSADMNNKVLVHFFNGSASERDYNRTLLVGVLGAGQAFTSPFLNPAAWVPWPAVLDRYWACQ